MQIKKITELHRISPEEFKEAHKIPLIVVLDNVRSLHNIGSIFRSSDAFRVQAIYLCGITATPPHVEIHKTALGAENTVDWLYFEQTMGAIEKLKAENYTICAVEQVKESILLNELRLDTTQKYALVLGNEVKGVQQEVVNNCSLCVEIPQCGTKHSLNVSVAGGIVIWDFWKQLS